MRLRKIKNVKQSTIGVRCTKREREFIRKRAMLYCEGNLSEYIVYCCLNFVIGKQDIEEGGIIPPRKN